MFEKAVEVLDWFKSLNAKERPVSIEIRGDHFAVKADGTLGEAIHPVLPVAPVATPVLKLSTLSGLVAAFTAKLDGFDGKGASAVQVESYNSVAIVSLAADEWGRRQVWARTTCTEENPFPFDSYIDQEQFLIKAQAGFMPIDGNYTNMLKLCSSLKAGTTVDLADDGFSQKVVVSGGGVTHAEVQLPPRIGLRPYRTFREIDPVESDFLLRFRAIDKDVPKIALIAVDAGRWKTDTAMAVEHWLQANLPNGVTIIA